MSNELVMYQETAITVPENWQEEVWFLPEPTPCATQYQAWLKLIKEIENQHDWSQERERGFRYHARVEIEQNVGIFTFSGQLYEQARICDFSPKGLRIAGEKPLKRDQILLLSAPGFRAAAEVKHSFGTMAGCELLNIRLNGSHLIIDTRV